MRTTRKIVSLLLTIAMVCTVLFANVSVAFAASTLDMSVQAGAASVQRGDDLSVEVKLGESDALAAVQFTLKYDAQKLTYDGYSVGGALTGMTKVINTDTPGEVAAVGYAADNQSNAANETILTVHFKVQDEAAAGDTVVSLSDIVLADELGNAYTANPAAPETQVCITAGNTAPTRKADVGATAEASVLKGASYTLDLSTIFEDAQGDALNYQVSVNGAQKVAADESYAYTPADAGITTLLFSANDGTLDSLDTYTVTLTAREPKTLSITFAALDNGDASAPFAVSRQEITVTEGTAAKYGLENAAPGTMVGGQDHGVQPGEITALDALLAMHEVKYGESFTKETMGSYFAGTSTYVSKMFGISGNGICFAVNDRVPVGPMSDGYGVNEYVLSNGDYVAFFTMGDAYWGDYYSYFDATEKTVTVGEQFGLTLSAYSAMGSMWGSPGTPTQEATVSPVENAVITVINPENGSAAYLADGSVLTDENGQFTYSFDTAGTYILSAEAWVYDSMWDNIMPATAPWCKVVVENPVVTISPVLVDGTAAEADIAVTDSEGNTIAPTEAGGNSFLLEGGKTYTYTVSKAGYVTRTGSIDEIKAQTINVLLLKDVAVEWDSFRGNENNQGITASDTPVSANETEQLWAKALGTGWSAAPSGQIIVDNSIVVMSGAKKLFKLDKATGEILAQADLAAGTGFGIVNPAYGAGMIFCPLSGGKIQAFDAETLTPLWLYTDPLGGQVNVPITYSDGMIYCGFWNSETKDANYVGISVADEDITQTMEEKQAAWSYTSAGGFYWAGSVAHGDCLYFGTDDGTSSSDSETAKILCVDKKTGEVKDSATVVGDQRSSVAYDNGKLYFTTKAGYLYLAVLNEDGTFGEIKSKKIASMSTSTPVVFNGRVYMGLTTGGNFDGTYAIVVIDADTLEPIYSVAMPGYPQGSVLLSTKDFDTTGDVYIYATYNAQPGGIIMFRDNASITAYDEANVIDLFVPENPNYCISSIIADSNGTLYYKNDSGHIFALGKTSAYLTDLTVSGGNAEMKPESYDGGTLNYEVVVDAGTAQVELTPKTTVPDAVITVNGDAVASGSAKTLTLSDGRANAEIVVESGTKTRTYTVNIREKSADATLTSLYANTSNSYSSSRLALSPAFDADTAEYEAARATTVRSFINIWPDATDANAAVTVTGVSGTTSDGAEIPVTATNAGHNRYAVYFADGVSKAQVKIHITAENGTDTKDYLLTLNNKVTITAGTAQRLSATAGSASFTFSEDAKYYYAIVSAGSDAPTVDTTGEGQTVTKATETTIQANALSTLGAQEIYVVVTDSAGAQLAAITLSIPEITKEIAKGMLDTYKNAADYRTAQQEELARAIAAGKSAIDAAESFDAYIAAMEAAKEAMDGIKTDAQLTAEELASAKAAAKTELDGYKNAQDYREAQRAELEQAVTAGKNSIEAATDQAGVAAALQAAKEVLDAIKTDAQLTAEENEAAAAAVDEKIAVIGTVTLESKAAIDVARAAYNALSGAQQALVTKLSDLLAAEAEYDRLVEEAEKLAADQAAAKGVDDMIAALGIITLDSKQAIEDSRTAYEALSADQQALVTKLAQLEAAEQAYADLFAQAKQDAKDALDAYKQPSDYRTAEQEQLRQMISAGKAAIDAAADQAAIVQALEAAKTAMDGLRTARQWEEIEQPAQAVEEMISAIDTASFARETAIAQARGAYEALSAEQKGMVANEAQLIALEESMRVLQAALQAADITVIAPAGVTVSGVSIDNLSLTAEEKQAVATGEKLTVILDVKTVTEGQAGADAAIAKAALNGKTMAGYYQITVKKQIGTREAVLLNSFKTPLSLTLPIRAEWKAPTGAIRTFVAIRVHDGCATVLLNEDSTQETLKITSGQYSIYAVAYDEVVPGKTTLTTDTRTGDDSYPGLWILCILAAASVMSCVVWRSYKIGKNG